MTDKISNITILIGDQPIDGALVHRNDALLAVLSFDEPFGRWQVEAVFGKLDSNTMPESFADLEEAAAWFRAARP